MRAAGLPLARGEREPEDAAGRQALLRRLAREPGAWVGGALLLGAVFVALAAPWLAPHPPAAIDLGAQFAPPGPGHWAGTDLYGRDILSRMLYGARATLSAAGIAVALAAGVGTTLGLVGGYLRGWPGLVLAGAIDLLLAFPALLLALMVVALLGPGLVTLAVAVGIAGIPRYARFVRSATQVQRNVPYVEAAQAMGAGPARILWRHILPGLLMPWLALVGLDAGWAILDVAGLGFLGLGAAPPQAEWGLMLFEGREYLRLAPWASAFPGLAISLTVLAATLLADALGQATEPHG